MLNSLLVLLAVVLLCAGWAVFQIWLSRHDPDANQCLRNCGDCNCKDATSGSEPFTEGL